VLVLALLLDRLLSCKGIGFENTSLGTQLLDGGDVSRGIGNALGGFIV